jgi:16S rRNA (uracil1498-N3)-methyltransferase
MPRRCFCEAPITDARTTLAGSEAHHLLHVLRAVPGMVVTLFDGSGAEFDAEVAACGRSTVDLVMLERREVNRELPFPLTLGVALPKGDRQRWIIEKAVELGVTRLVPLVTERSEKQGGEKLARYVIEASKQCGRNRLMEIADPQRWSVWLAAIPPGDAAAPVRTWIADPAGRALTASDLAHDRPALIAIGPEGGLTNEESAEAAETEWELIGLGPRILRIETAAVALVSSLALTATSSLESRMNADKR